MDRPSDSTPSYALFGAGRWADIHARQLKPFVGDPLAISTSDPDRSTEWAEKGVRVFPRGDAEGNPLVDAFSDGEIAPDFAVVSVLAHANAATLRALLSSRASLKAILIEKAPVRSVVGTKALLDMAEEKSTQLVMAAQTRYAPVRRHIVDDVQLSETRSIRIRRKFPYASPLPGQAGVEKHGSVVWNLLPHSVAELQYLLSRHGHTLDSLEIFSVAPLIHSDAHRKKHIPDTVIVSAHLEATDTLVILEASQAALSGECANDTLIDGSGHCVRFEETRETYIVEKDGEQVVTYPNVDVMRLQARDFLRSIGLMEPSAEDKPLIDTQREHERILEMVRFLARVHEQAQL